MLTNTPQCEDLQGQVRTILELLQNESALRHIDLTPVQTSLKKALSHRFEIVFAGAFSAGKSMLINALLGRELLYSAEGHATATECRIEYAESGKERVVLTFLSEMEIKEQITALCQDLSLSVPENISDDSLVNNLYKQGELIITQEGGKDKTKKAKQANALIFLIEGFVANRGSIKTKENATYPMEDFNFENLQQAAEYARRGRNSAVLKRIEYYCHHPLLADGNVIIDTPGIDAPVERDAQLAYNKINNTETSAVVCILKYAKDGDMVTEETQLLESMRQNLGIRDRVFYIFNYIDETWDKPEKRRRLEDLILTQFQPPARVYKTSGILGFYGSLLKHRGNSQNSWGLDTFLADMEEPHPFVSEFKDYCTSGKLPSNFRIEVRGYETPNENYIRILNDSGLSLIDQIINDSGIEIFKDGLQHYLTDEKIPELFTNLADDLEQICINLKKHYLNMQRQLDSQPREIYQMKEKELQLLNQQLTEISVKFKQHIEGEVIDLIDGKNNSFNESFSQLQNQMLDTLNQLINNFSVGLAHNQAIRSHRRNTVVPLLAILAEGFYYLANELEEVLTKSVKELVISLFQGLIKRVKTAEYYRDLNRLLAEDAGIEHQLKLLANKVIDALINEARTECDRYVRERPEFYNFSTSSSMGGLQTTLQQACLTYDYNSMNSAETAIKKLLKADFEPKVLVTINQIFRQTIQMTLRTHLTELSANLGEGIMQQYEKARGYLGQTLEKKAQNQVQQNQRLQSALKERMITYNQTVFKINNCLLSMQIERKLPLIEKYDLRHSMQSSLGLEDQESEQLLDVFEL
jgi:Dynamin family